MKNNWRKAEVSAVISRLLQPKVGHMVSKGDLGAMGDEVVAAGWSQFPDVFEGNFGTRPHNISIAAFCLFQFLKTYDRREDVIEIMGHCFLEVMAEIDRHGDLYGLTKTDEFVLEQPLQYLRILQSTRES